MTSITAGPDRPLRKDAEHNRRLILDVAAQAFAERGLDVGFEEIARRAGIGVGTVYRRFPDRKVLVEALFAQRIEEMISLAQASLDDPDPWSGLCGFLAGSLQMQVSDRGLRAVLGTTTHGSGALAVVQERLRPVVDAVVARAIDAGELRRDVHTLDLGVLSWMISAATPQDQPDLWRRYLVLVLDGLREQRTAPTPLPLQAPDEASLDDLLHLAPRRSSSAPPATLR